MIPALEVCFVHHSMNLHNIVNVEHSISLAYYTTEYAET